MASRFAKLLNERGNHEVGNLNSHVFEQVNEGAIVGDETIDNFLLVELYFDHEVADDATSPMVRKARVSADVTKNTHLIASIEERVSIPGFYTEQFDDFFNEKGEKAAIYILAPGKRFETSAFALCAETGKEVAKVQNGMEAYFDGDKKKYIIIDPTKAPDAYATAAKKFLVVANENDDDLNTLCGRSLVRLEVLA